MTHSAGIKSLIDHAWGVGHVKQKKKESADVPIPDPSDPLSREKLSFSPVGQDSSRKRYWVVDGVYTPFFSIPVIFVCICADPICSMCSLSFPMLRRSPSVSYLKLRCRLAHAPDPLRLPKGIRVDQSLEGYVNFPNRIFYKRRICCLDWETERICTCQTQVESRVCASESHVSPRRALRSY